MRGIDADTGKAIDGLEHLRQSVSDILTTPVGTRVMRRDYGSELFRLVDAPLTPANILRLIKATAVALARWEPRIRVQRVQVTAAAESGRIQIDLQGQYRPTGRPFRLEGIVA